MVVRDSVDEKHVGLTGLFMVIVGTTRKLTCEPAGKDKICTYSRTRRPVFSSIDAYDQLQGS